MWIRVESFEPSSSPIVPTAVWNFFGGRRRQNEDDETILFSLGRKTGDVTFPNDKTVSRQHCAVRCIHEDEARNDAERRACQANPFHMCLVVDNFGGKTGTFIAESPPTDHAVTNSDDDETDDEGGWVVSHAALEDGTIVTDAVLPESIRHFWNEEQPPLMVRLEVGQSRVLDFTKPNQERSIMVQPGYHGSTIKITWVPFFVVFSNVGLSMHNYWETRLEELGALKDADITEATTHLITPSFLPTSMRLIAYRRGIPIVTMDYLEALVNYKSSTDPIPLVEQYLSPFPENGSLIALQSKTTDPRLMAGYVVFTLSEKEIDPLVLFVGGTLIPLHEEPDEKARIDKLNFTREVYAAANNTKESQVVFLVMASMKQIFSKLASRDGIFLLKPETWAKAISQQDPKLVDTEGFMIPLPSPPTTSSTSTPSRNAEQKDTNVSENDSDTEGFVVLPA